MNPAAAQSGKTRRSRNSLSRAEILQAAGDLIREEGIQSLSMRSIANRLQCSVASPYAHFRNQEEIIRELIVEGEKRLTAELKNARASAQGVHDQLAAIARTYWNFAGDNREQHKLMFNMGAGRMYRKVFPNLPTSYRVFLETIRDGIKNGSIPYPRKMYASIARTMWAWMYGLIVLDMEDMLRLRGPEDHPIEEGIFLFQLLLSRNLIDSRKPTID